MSLFEPLTGAELLRRVADEHAGEAPALDATVTLESGHQAQPTQLTFPAPVDPKSQRQIARYVASEANNVAVVRGGRRLHVRCPPQLPTEMVLEALDRHYSQLHQLLAEPVAVTASTQPPEHRVQPAPAPGGRRPVRPTAEGRTAIGINIGQTNTKAVVATAAGIRDRLRWCARTFPADLPKGRQLADRVAGAAETAVASAGGAVDGIGVAVGGIVASGTICRSSGVALGLRDDDYQALAALPAVLRERYDVEVWLLQDVEAKAWYQAVRSGARDCLVLDLGTSLGGAYVDADGILPPYLNQVGRIAFDLDESAVPRADRRGDGLLSQYLSARGFIGLAAETGAAMVNLGELERVVASPTLPGEERFLQLLQSRIETGVALAAAPYRPSTIVLSGGVMNGRFGPVVRSWLQLLGRYEVALSDEPLFDACIGAAWIALDGGRG